MTAKEFLLQGRFLAKEISLDRERLEELRSIAERSTSSITGMPRSGKGSAREAAVAAMLDREAELAQDLRDQVQIEKDISTAIRNIKDPRHRFLLKLRYQENAAWGEVAAKMGYSVSQIERLHRAALRVVVVPEKYRDL